MFADANPQTASTHTRREVANILLVISMNTRMQAMKCIFCVFAHHDFHGIPLKNYGAPVVFFVGLKNLLTWYNFVVPSWISELKIIQLFDNFENDK